MTAKMVKSLEGMTYAEWLNIVGVCSTLRRLRGDLIAVYNFLMGGGKEGGDDLVSLVSGDKDTKAMPHSCITNSSD